MKTKILGFILAGGLFLSTSCSGFLDQVPNDVMTVDDLFKSKGNIDHYLAQVYANIPNELSQRLGEQRSGSWTAASDEAKYNWDFHYANEMVSGTWASTDDRVEDRWTDFYKAIRTATDFINKIDGATESAEVTATLKTRYKAEARGLRAMYYYWLIRMYGPVPLVNSVQAADAPLEELLLPRNSMDECVNFIVEQLDSAYIDLPVVPDDSGLQLGRITKGMAKAFKTEVLLLNASPLFNGNTDMSTLVDKDGKVLINQTYDQNKWKLAAEAAKDFLDEFVPTTYDLYVEANADPFLQAYNSTKNVMYTEWNKEWIFARPRSMNRSRYDKTPKHAGFSGSVQGAGALGVTQKMVDAYAMKNGLPITDATSGYVATGFSDYKAPFDTKTRSTYNPWTNREPRFYVGITYNRSLWLYPANGNSEVITVMELSGNSGRKQSDSDVSPTGYIVRKNVKADEDDRGDLQLRLGQIYLDYAEALNEYDPGNADILKYVNLIRTRAGVPVYGSGTGKLPAPASQEAMREAIHRERQIELAFENVRYFDCRRWKTAEVEFAGNVYGLDMYADGNAFYEKTLIENRVFRQRDYLWPIPNEEILKNKLMVQNPGW